MMETLIVVVAAFAIGFSRAGIRGGLGPLITVLMVIVFSPNTALALLLPMLIVGDVFALAALWRQWDLRQVWLLLPGATEGRSYEGRSCGCGGRS